MIDHPLANPHQCTLSLICRKTLVPRPSISFKEQTIISCLVVMFTFCDPMDCRTPGFSVLHRVLELAQVQIHLVSDAIQPSLSLSSPAPLLSNFSSIRVYSNQSALPIRWSKYRSFTFSIIPYSDYSVMISCRTDWLDLAASPTDTQESSPTPQFKSINSLVLSHLYAPTLTSIHD